MAALACSAVACGLGTSGLMGVDDDASTVPSPVKPNGSSGGTSSGGTSNGGTSNGGSTSSGGDPGSSDGAPGNGGSSSSSSGGDANVSSSDDAASSIAEADTPDVHVLNPDASYAEAGDECDLDEDGYRSASGTCGGTDCCDYDGRAHPGEKSYYATPDACGSFDYDCDTKDEPQYGTVNCTFGVFTCNGDGFEQTPPACGVSATFDSCDYYVVYCGTSQSSKAQPCK